MNNNSTSTISDTNDDDFDASGLTYGVAFALGAIFLGSTITIACIRLARSRNHNRFNRMGGIRPGMGEGSNEQRQGGLDDATLASYPKQLYSEVLQKHSSNVSSSCSICLGDYKETDMLRMLPDCGHVYHLGCVDPWLKLHPTCPICRTSSAEALQPAGNSIVTEGSHVVQMSSLESTNNIFPLHSLYPNSTLI